MKIRSLCLLLLIFMGTVFNLTYANEHKIYSFPTKSQQQQFQHLTFELRCLVCQNQNLAESNAKLAADLRGEIAKMIHKGYSNQQVIGFMVKRYGDYILYKPPLNHTTWLLWIGPFILLILGLLILGLIVTTIRKRSPSEETLSEDDKAKLKQLLKS